MNCSRYNALFSVVLLLYLVELSTTSVNLLSKKEKKKLKHCDDGPSILTISLLVPISLSPVVTSVSSDQDKCKPHGDQEHDHNCPRHNSNDDVVCIVLGGIQTSIGGGADCWCLHRQHC